MPPASRRTSARACECCRDEGRLAFCVGLTVEWMLGRERTLQSGVAFTQSWICAQCIPEGHMASQFIRCLRHHIKVMSRLARRTAKRLSPCHPDLAPLSRTPYSLHGGIPRSPSWTYLRPARRRITSGASARETTTSRSTTGFAARPGTTVLPMCSIRSTRLPSAVCTLAASTAKQSGHVGSYSRISNGDSSCAISPGAVRCSEKSPEVRRPQGFFV